MLQFSTSVSTRGKIPEPFAIDDFFSRDSIISRADRIYDTNPNLVARLHSDHGFVVIKWFGWRHLIHYPLSPTFPSRAHASWTIANALKETQARTPEPLYVYTHRYRGFIRENYFITEAIHPHTCLRPLLISDVSEAFLRTSIEDLAHSIARMHKHGIIHRDLTTANFLVNEDGAVFIVDLNRAQQLKKLIEHHRLIDLARLSFKTRNTELEDRLSHQFFYTYEEESGLGTNLLNRYRKYRKRLLKRRQLKKKVQRLIR